MTTASRAIALALSTLMLVPGAAVASTIGMDAPGGSSANDWNEEPNFTPTADADRVIPNNHFYEHVYKGWDDSFRLPIDNAAAWEAARGDPLGNPAIAPVSTRILNGKYTHYTYPTTLVGGTLGGTGHGTVGAWDHNKLLDRLVGAETVDDFMFPGVQSAFVAFTGRWADIDGDGFKDDADYVWRDGVNGAGHANPVYIHTDSADRCEQGDLTVPEDPQVYIDALTSPDVPGSSDNAVGGNPDNTAPAVNHPEGLEWRCTVQDEWIGDDGQNSKLVTYMYPSDWNIRTPWGDVGGVLGAGGIQGAEGGNKSNNLVCPTPGVNDMDSCGKTTAKGQMAPFQTYLRSVQWYGSGGYLGDNTKALTGVTEDGSLLEKRITETFTDSEASATSWRARESTSASIFDVDVWHAIDPAVEGLYQTFLVTGAFAFETATPITNSTVQGALNTEDLIKNQLGFCDGTPNQAVGCFAGPTNAQSSPPREVEDGSAPALGPNNLPSNPGHNYQTGIHPYLDVHLREEWEVMAVLTAVDVGPNLLFDGQNSIDNSGAAGEPGSGNSASFLVLSAGGVLGLWRDLNGDGFVGQPEVRNGHGCGESDITGETDPNTSPYNCGATQNPNTYDIAGSGAASQGEFTPTCAPADSRRTPDPADKEPNFFYLRYTALEDDLETVTDWGAQGYYKLYDASSGANSTQGGVANFNYADDVLDEGAAYVTGRLITDGKPITVHLTCDGRPGQAGTMDTYEMIVVLGGAAQLNVLVETEPGVTTTFATSGINQEATWDRDLETRWFS